MYEVAEAGYWLMAQIHDDLTAAIPLDKLDEYISFVSKAMTVGVQKVYPPLASIPLTVEVEAGFKYGEMDYLKKTNRRREYSSTDFME
jgi:DNA polymerase I-like protein with 3'-5' exonuclease and polymerase domains